METLEFQIANACNVNAVPAGIALFLQRLRCSCRDCAVPAGIALFLQGLRCSGSDCVVPAGIALFQQGLRCSYRDCAVTGKYQVNASKRIFNIYRNVL